MFNSLEIIARSQTPETPVLNCRISRALEPRNVNDAVRIYFQKQFILEF